MTWGEWLKAKGDPAWYTAVDCRRAWDAARSDAEAELRGVLGDLMRWLAFPADAQARQALARRVAAGVGGDAADVLRKLAAVATGKGGA